MVCCLNVEATIFKHALLTLGDTFAFRLPLSFAVHELSNRPLHGFPSRHRAEPVYIGFMKMATNQKKLPSLKDIRGRAGLEFLGP